MKKTRIVSKFCTTLLIVGSLLSACSEDGAANVENTPGAVRSIMKSGTWKITSFMDSDVDKTANFEGFVFVFGDNNMLTASKVSESYSGTWSVSNSNSNDDTPNDLDFNILFANPTFFSEITDDWDIVSKSATKLELMDESNGNGGTDYLTFEKN